MIFKFSETIFPFFNNFFLALPATIKYNNPNIPNEVIHIIGSMINKPIKIIDIIKLFYEYFQKYEDFEKIKNLIKNKTKSTGEIPFQSMDYKKLYKFFKWKPKYNLSNTIEETYKWYYNFFKRKI